MELYVEMKSKKEIEANMDRLVSAFVSLAEDLLKEKEGSKRSAIAKTETSKRKIVKADKPKKEKE